jgi:hypothetical protein
MVGKVDARGPLFNNAEQNSGGVLEVNPVSQATVSASSCRDAASRLAVKETVYTGHSAVWVTGLYNHSTVIDTVL